MEDMTRTETTIGENEEGFYIYEMKFDENNNMNSSDDLREGIATIEEARKELRELAEIKTEEGYYEAEWKGEDKCILRHTDKSYQEDEGEKRVSYTGYNDVAVNEDGEYVSPASSNVSDEEFE